MASLRIILYAITGCVSALFCVVILSGVRDFLTSAWFVFRSRILIANNQAIRAFRHPEQYGPRSGSRQANGQTWGPQSRTVGLGRAMLDSFPLIKFGHVEGSSSAPAPPKAVDLERDGADANPEDDVNPHISVDESAATSDVRDREQRRSRALSSTFAAHEIDFEEGSHSDINASSHPDNHKPDEETKKPSSLIDPESIGRETCPICIIDFEHGDDLRVLPCEGKHRFHQHCVDPWLLQLSSSCPICRAGIVILS